MILFSFSRQNLSGDRILQFVRKSQYSIYSTKLNIIELTSYCFCRNQGNWRTSLLFGSFHAELVRSREHLLGQMLKIAPMSKLTLLMWCWNKKYLSCLLEKKVKWNWKAMYQRSFEGIQQSLMRSQVLVIVDQNRPFYVISDASDCAIICTPMQYKTDGAERVACYQSRQQQAARA